MRIGLLGTASCAVLLVAACGSSRSSGIDHESATESATGNVTHTSLPDVNYATKTMLEARNRGLAAESAEDADPAKAGTIDPIAIDPHRSDYPDVARKWGQARPDHQSGAKARCDHRGQGCALRRREQHPDYRSWDPHRRPLHG